MHPERLALPLTGVPLGDAISDIDGLDDVPLVDAGVGDVTLDIVALSCSSGVSNCSGVTVIVGASVGGSSLHLVKAKHD